jgi:cytochrome b561
LWQRVSSEPAHWLLYALVLAATLTGWLFASFRGWSVSYFNFVSLPMLATKNAVAIKQIDGRYQIAEWALLVLICIHVAAALAHIFSCRDRIMQRMLPSRRRLLAKVSMTEGRFRPRSLCAHGLA